MNTYTKDYRVSYTDADMNRRLRVSRLFTLLQEASMTHAAMLGLGDDKTLDAGILWIVTLQQAAVTRMPVYDESIRIETWPGKVRHFLFPRYYRITDTEGSTLIEASSFWALMDENTRRVVFPGQRGVVPADAEEEKTIPLPVSPEAPRTDTVGTFTVPLSYVDLNGHMNNTRYFDLAEDRIPEAFRSREIRLIRSEYAREARLDAELALKCETVGDTFLLAGENDGKKLFKVSLTYAPES